MSALLGDRCAVVTGGSRGIGRAIVEAFAAAGARVLACGRSEPEDLPDGVLWQSVDVARAGAIDALAVDAEVRLGRVDVLVNNAGVQVEKTVVESSDADWDLVMGVNARAVFEACRRFVPTMAARGGGVIVNIGSIGATHADPSMALSAEDCAGAVDRSSAEDGRTSIPEVPSSPSATLACAPRPRRAQPGGLAARCLTPRARAPRPGSRGMPPGSPPQRGASAGARRRLHRRTR